MINKQALDCCFVCELVDRGGYQAYETLITKGTVCNLTRASEGLIGSGQVTYGAFRDKRLIGLVASSIHELTNKATIERLLVDHSPATSSIIKLLLDSLLQDLATQCVSFVTAHPPIQEAEVPGLMELLELLGFEKRLIFRANTLAIDVSADLLSSDHVAK